MASNGVFVDMNGIFTLHGWDDGYVKRKKGESTTWTKLWLKHSELEISILT